MTISSSQQVAPPGSSDISVRLSAGRTVSGTRHLDDGRYVLVLQAAPGDDPPLTLEAGGGVFFSGRMSHLTRSRR